MREIGKVSADCLLDARLKGGEFVVTVDVRATNEADLVAGVDPRREALVVSEDETVIARVPLPWGSVDPVEATLNHGVLTVRLRPA